MKTKIILSTLMITALSFSTFTSCKKKVCTDPNADNYSAESKKDDGTCTFPTINISSTNTSGDISGAGGTASGSATFANNNTTVGWDAAIDASEGSFQLVILDADGKIVVDKTLTAGSGAQDAGGTSTSGTSGTWTATITLTSFNGTGDYSIQ